MIRFMPPEAKKCELVQRQLNQLNQLIQNWLPEGSFAETCKAYVALLTGITRGYE